MFLRSTGQRLPEISILVGVTSLEVNTVIIGPHVLHVWRVGMSGFVP